MKMKMVPALVMALAVAAVAAAAIVLLRQSTATPLASTLRPGDAAVRAQGQRIYTAHCAQCHGSELQGQADWRTRGPDGLLPAPPHDDTGHTWHHPDELLFRLTKFGVARTLDMPDYRSSMPAYETVLSDDEIVAVLSWIKSRWPVSIRERHDQINAQDARERSR